ncbi:MAG: 30S ribosomal protein S17 [Rhodospirillaceae bacterium]|jgi:small subunit ribosomal protein S17|nr:30S ribosomal protein S17 [Rhodospirillaceae bacterium]MBR86597.1 30S ribosomal protein S17 [Rhodospirillaceae bacterium]|tara:strand:+ start:376 stop:606 length:231 start_codon:yes stop_codon:yes gene_type:complete
MPKRVMQGVVVSNAMDKTLVVKVERKFPHPLYKKFIKRSSRYHVHDENNQHKVGDLVSIRECRPLSKLKKWEVIAV